MKKNAFLFFFLFLSLQVYSIDGVLIKTIDYSFGEKWNNTLSAAVPNVSTCDEVFKKQYFYLAPMIKAYELDANGRSDVRYSIKITKPDGAVYFSQEDIVLSQAKIQDKDYLQMGDAVLKICFENEDQLGVYKIVIDIVDKVSAKAKTIEDEIALIELPAYDGYVVKGDDDFIEWMNVYYKKLQPENALAYYVYYIQSDLSQDDSKFYPVFALFLEIFKNNTFLSPQVVSCYKTQDLRTRMFLLYLMYHSELATNSFYEELEGDEKDTYLDLKDSPRINIYDTIVDGAQLDMLWATFLVSGSYKPILKLIQTLDYVVYQGYLDKFKESLQTEEDRQKAVNNAIYDALIWSLESNVRQHKLVSDYCKWAYQFEKLSDVQKEELRKIIE